VSKILTHKLTSTLSLGGGEREGSHEIWAKSDH
jgi:hypothetical protein